MGEKVRFHLASVCSASIIQEDLNRHEALDVDSTEESLDIDTEETELTDITPEVPRHASNSENGNNKEIKPMTDSAPFVLTPNDTNDPSYTDLVIPYRVVCRMRYHETFKKMEEKFIKEVKEYELFQSKALDGVRIHRIFCKTMIKAPSSKQMITLSEKQQARIEELLARKY